MGAHLIDDQFQSDKYPTTPRGKVPLSCGDQSAQDLLWTYAQRRRPIDAEFSDDLEAALINEGFRPPPAKPEWEIIEPRGQTERLRIPGGWLYRTIIEAFDTGTGTATPRVSMVFVRFADLLGDPENVKASL